MYEGQIFKIFKNAQVVTNLLTSCNNLLQQVDIMQDAFPCLRQLVTTSLLQFVKRLGASCQQTCYKLIISTSLSQVVSTSFNKSAIDKLQQA